MINVLVFSTLFPNRVSPHHGIFVEQRLKELLDTGKVSATVVAPVPWFPFKSSIFGSYSRFASVPRTETRSGLTIYHPRYPLIPKVGMTLAPGLMAMATYRTMFDILRSSNEIDLIDAHYFYPDGVAAVLLGTWLNKPVVVTARGTDVNLVPKYYFPKKFIKWAGNRCAKVITVSDALRDRLREIGFPLKDVITLRNGVDLELFRPSAVREDIRARLGVDGLTLLSVGHLIERKGHHLIIESLVHLPQANLLIVGDGPMHGQLEALAVGLGVSERVRFIGSIPQSRLPEYYNCADALVLASSREGMANVLLESIACGTPVLATPIWGSPEVIASPAAGLLLEDRSVDSIVAGVRRLFDRRPNREDVRSYARKFSWEDTTRGQLELFESILKLPT